MLGEKKRFLRGFFPEKNARQKFAQEKKTRILPAAEEIFGSNNFWRHEEVFRGLFLDCYIIELKSVHDEAYLPSTG